MKQLAATQTAQAIKQCCATLYQSELASFLLGDSFHPGGLALTQRLGELLHLKPGQQVLDVAAGQGTSALFLAQRFGCQVVGIDYSHDTVAQANRQIAAANFSHLVRVEQGDAEQLSFDDNSFDAIICECAFCTFPNKVAAAQEFGRVLRPGSRAGLSDLTRVGTLPSELATLLAWIACVADAQPVGRYAAYLQEAGFVIDVIEPHDAVLAALVRQVQTKLLGAEVMVKLGKLDLPGVDLEQAKQLARHTAAAVKTGQLGYTIITADKS